jgi:hypothetical protein
LAWLNPSRLCLLLLCLLDRNLGNFFRIRLQHVFLIIPAPQFGILSEEKPLLYE